MHRTRACPRFLRGWGCMRGPPSLPFPPLPSPLLFPSLFFPFPLPLTLEVGPLNATRGFGVCDRAPADIEFGAFCLYNMTFGGSNFTNFPELCVFDLFIW